MDHMVTYKYSPTKKNGLQGLASHRYSLSFGFKRWTSSLSAVLPNMLKKKKSQGWMDEKAEYIAVELVTHGWELRMEKYWAC